jgi:hypothetical protein
VAVFLVSAFRRPSCVELWRRRSPYTLLAFSLFDHEVAWAIFNASHDDHLPIVGIVGRQLAGYLRRLESSPGGGNHRVVNCETQAEGAPGGLAQEELEDPCGWDFSED